MSGKWDYDYMIVTGPRMRDGAAGLRVITPLVRSSGTTVLADRGFVSKNALEKFLRAIRTDK